MIDAHNHLDFEAFAADRASVVAEARRHGVESWVLAATEPATWARTREVAAETGGTAVLGVHPGWTDRIDDWDSAAQLLRDADPDGIGEIGLDRRSAPSDAAFAWQLAGLRAQLAVARELDRPVIFHCVGAYPELLAVVRRDGLPEASGFLHGWSGPPDRVAEAIGLGLGVSFGPAITGSHAPRQVASARAVPADRLFIETDCPDQAPRATRGARGTPADLPLVADAVARARGEDAATVRRVTHDNVVRLFGLGRP